MTDNDMVQSYTDFVGEDEELQDVPRPEVYDGGSKKSKRTKAKEAKAQAADGTSEPKEPKAPKVRIQNDCQCGCGGKTFSLFVPGHDATVKSQLLKVARGKLAHEDVSPVAWALVESNEKWAAVWQYAQDKAATEAQQAEAKRLEKERLAEEARLAKANAPADTGE